MNNINNNITTDNNSKKQMIIIKEGLLKKRSGRMVQWTTRYFTLYPTILSYKTKQDHLSNRSLSSSSTTTSYELVPGCLVTDITEETRVSIKGKKWYSFWVVWPHNKSNIDDDNKEVKNSSNEVDSDGEQHHHSNKTTVTSADTNLSIDDADDVDSGHSTLNAINQAIVSSHQSSSSSHGSSTTTGTTTTTTTTTGRKDVQSIVASEVMVQKRQRQLVEEQVEMHQAHDINVATGAKIAAVALGGVAIGVMTMVGLSMMNW